MFNIEVRNALKQQGFHNYELAAFLGVSETALSRKLSRKELNTDEKDHLLKSIMRMAERRMEMIEDAKEH